MSFQAFLRQNAIVPQNTKVIISERFHGVDGAPEPWELRALSEKEHADIKDACTSKRMFKGRMTTNFNSGLYICRLCAVSVVTPDLKNTELQKSYGVVGEDELLTAMLLPGEMATLQEYVQEVNGFDPEKLEKDKDEVKNS